MDGIGFLNAVVLGVVEGLTEFLPISSTGHLILAAEALSISGEKAKLFEVFIQLGAILAVVWFYRSKIFTLITRFTRERGVQRFWLNIGVAFLPAAFVGLATHDFIKEHLFGWVTVAAALVAGGFIILFIEKRRHTNLIGDIDSIPVQMALIVGIAQVAALFPGVSRSGATIMGGLLAGMTRKAAIEFSFFLAIPTMLAATLFDLSKSFTILSPSDGIILGVGFVTAFVSALWVVKWLLQFISNNDFRSFAYYRIIFGGILLCAYWFMQGQP